MPGDSEKSKHLRSRSVRELLRRLRPYTRPHRRYVAWLFACLLVGLPLAWAVPFLIKEVFDVAVPKGDVAAIVRLGLILAGITFAGALLALCRGIATTLFHNRSLHRLRLELFRVYQTLRVSFVQNHETGELMSRLSDDVANLGGVMADTFAGAVSAAVQLVVVGVILFTRQWVLASVAIAGAAVLLLLHLAFNRPLRERSRIVREKGTELSSDMHQAISGHNLIRATAAEPREARRFSVALAAAVRATVRRDLFGLFAGHPSVILGGIFPIALLLLGASFIAGGSMTQGDLFAAFMLLGQLFDAASTLGRLNPAFQASLASLDRISDVLDAEKTERQPSGSTRLSPIRGDVAFEDVTFGYDPAKAPDRAVLRGVTFSVAAGSRNAIVGRSGAGKTTMLALIPRFFEPWSGRILIDGVPLADLETQSLREQIGIVPQDVFLFDRTVMENIAYGRPGATEAQVRAAADAACATEFILAMPAGFETRIGERGVRLSGGQRQRLAIARELLRDPRIIILDEATASLDSETELAVQRASARLLAGRTSFVIAHRLATVRHADEIFVLDEGRLVARGDHESLLKSSPIYRELTLLQTLEGSGTGTGVGRGWE